MENKFIEVEVIKGKLKSPKIVALPVKDCKILLEALEAKDKEIFELKHEVSAIGSLASDKEADLRQEIAELRKELLKFYNADGTFEICENESEVMRKRIDASKQITEQAREIESLKAELKNRDGTSLIKFALESSEESFPEGHVSIEFCKALLNYVTDEAPKNKWFTNDCAEIIDNSNTVKCLKSENTKLKKLVGVYESALKPITAYVLATTGIAPVMRNIAKTALAKGQQILKNENKICPNCNNSLIERPDLGNVLKCNNCKFILDKI